MKLKTACLSIMIAGSLVGASTQAAANSLLPLGGDALRAKGYDLPEPFGVGVNYTNIRQNVEVSSINLSGLSLPLSVLNIPIPTSPAIPLPDQLLSIKAGETRMRSFTTGARADAWILPFMNVYVVAGKTRGSSVSQLRTEVNPVVAGQFAAALPGAIGGALSASGLPAEQLAGLASNPALAALNQHPEAVLQQLSPALNDLKQFRLNFKGATYGAGLTFAGGYKNFFASLDGNFTQTNFDVLDGHINAVTVTPRIGYRFNIPASDALHMSGSQLSVWIGSMYQYTQQTYSGKIGELGLPATLAPLASNGRFEVRQHLSSPWNMLVGAQYAITRNINIGAEVGFAQRNSLIVTGEFRF